MNQPRPTTRSLGGDQLGLPWRSPFVVDLFAGGGGASEGIRAALGVPPVLAVNHDPASIAMHEANHPTTMHRCESVFTVDPIEACQGRTPDLLWASPDCTHFSRAKGGKPRERSIRSLAWVVCEWAEAVRPRVICLENVPEFVTWGPLCPEGRVIADRKGETFQAFVERLEAAGYHVEWQSLRACDYGSPTTRQRLFLVARCDDEPIAWPEPTHGPAGERPYRTAAECIDWSIPACSIFATPDEAKTWAADTGQGRPRRPLADKTMARIAEGVRRYVLEAAEPYLVDGALVPALVNTRNGERKGQSPRTRDIRRPLGTVTAQGSQGGLVSAWMVKHYGGVIGHGLGRPIGTVTATDHHAVGVAELAQVEQGRARKVAAFLASYYGTGVGQDLDDPMRTVTSRDRFGLVTVQLDGEPWVITDITMRMLQPRELARAQGFPDSYVLEGTKTAQVARIGNSVCPDVAEALVAAQFPKIAAMRRAA